MHRLAISPFAMSQRRSIDWSGVLVQVIALLALVPFLMMAWDLLSNGLPHVSWSFLSEMPRRSGRAGGILSIIASTGMVLGVMIAAVVPMGLAAAIVLNEMGRTNAWFGRVIEVSLDVLSGVPSIVFGLFGNAFFCVYLGFGFSIASGGLTLACMALPIFVRAARAGLASVPDEWCRGGIALGMSRLSMLRHILLPGAGRAISVGLVLATGRALAETAAVLFTSGYVDRMPTSLLDSGRTLSVHIYDLSMNVAGGEKNAYATVVVLLGGIGVVNVVTYLFTEKILCRRVVQ